MPTGRVLIYIAALVGAAVFRVYYVGWFGEYLFWIVLLLPPLLVLCSLPSMIRAKAELSAGFSTNRGEAADASLRVNLRSLLPLGRLKARVSIKNLYTGKSFSANLSLLGTGSAVIGFPLPVEACGVLDCSVASLRYYDLLGLICIFGKKPQPVRVTVLPVAVPPVNAPDMDTALEQNKSLRPKPGGGYAEEHDLRDYRPGDPLRAMHWKLSSKMDKPIIREPQVNENTEVCVILDPEGSVERSLDALLWLCMRLCAMERPHKLYWRSEAGEFCRAVSAPGEAVAAFEELLCSPSLSPPRVESRGVLCTFTVKNGEVSYR